MICFDREKRLRIVLVELIFLPEQDIARFWNSPLLPSPPPQGISTTLLTLVPPLLFYGIPGYRGVDREIFYLEGLIFCFYSFMIVYFHRAFSSNDFFLLIFWFYCSKSSGKVIPQDGIPKILQNLGMDVQRSVLKCH